MVTGNRDLMRSINTNLVINVLRDCESISQADILRSTSLSAGTVTSIVKELKEGGFVIEIGPGESKLGRRPTLLKFNSLAKKIIAVEVSADEIAIAFLDLSGSIQNVKHIDFDTDKGPTEAMGLICLEVEQLLEGQGIDRKDVLGLGACFEGNISWATGRLMYSSVLGWKDAPVKEMLENGIGVNVIVDSKARASLFAEFCYGVAKGMQDVICVDVDFGIGSVSILDGRILRGSSNMAGEIGHSPVDPDGPQCRCGMKGCLEAIASGPAIAANFKNETEKESVDNISARKVLKQICQAARTGNKLSVKVVSEAADAIALAAAKVINFADPELVVLTGYVINESDGLMLELIRAKALENVFDSEYRNIRIEEGILGENSALQGIAAMVCEETFKSPLSND